MCSVAECSTQVKAKGMCVKHYTRWSRYGDPSINHRNKLTEELKSRYRYIRLEKDHPLGKASQSIPEHRMLLYQKIGPGQHPCHYCGTNITWVLLPRGKPRRDAGAIITDHLNRDSKDNRPDNLVPSCVNCNNHNTSARIAPEELTYTFPNGHTVRGISRECHYCGSMFVRPPSLGQKYCSTDCRYQRPKLIH